MCGQSRWRTSDGCWAGNGSNIYLVDDRDGYVWAGDPSVSSTEGEEDVGFEVFLFGVLVLGAQLEFLGCCVPSSPRNLCPLFVLGKWVSAVSTVVYEGSVWIFVVTALCWMYSLGWRCIWGISFCGGIIENDLSNSKVALGLNRLDGYLVAVGEDPLFGLSLEVFVLWLSRHILSLVILFFILWSYECCSLFGILFDWVIVRWRWRNNNIRIQRYPSSESSS